MSGIARTSGRVFVSSTCYDLIDLRAALEVTLRDSGLVPVMSDRPTSEFTNAGDANSIETCLVNLRNCERCIVVLSQRYGPSLKTAGFDDISATHLEYREAIKHGIPLLLYVRDRLWAEYETLKRNAGLVTTWARGDDAGRLFAFIAEIAKLHNADRPNWIWPFTSANDLCERVLADLGSAASTAAIRMLSEQGRLPQFSIYPGGWDNKIRTATLKNSGSVAALRVSVRDVLGQVVVGEQDFEPGKSHPVTFHFGAEVWSMCDGRCPVLHVDYETLTGERLSDLFAVLPDRNNIRILPAGRRLVGRALRSTSPEVTMVGGFHTVAMEPINRAYNEHAL